MKFSIEHIGISMEDPVRMANWYRDVLGFDIRFAEEKSDSAGAFISDTGHKVTLELLKLPVMKPIRPVLTHHLQLHIALTSEDPDSDAAMLMQNGATLIERGAKAPDGEYLVMLNDPWGNCLQLCRRGKTFKTRMKDEG